MYDLDKTQEWLNRTMQLGKTPAVRGGGTPDPNARKHTTLSVTAAFLIIILGMLLMSWTRMGARVDAGRILVGIEASVRVADAAPYRQAAGIPIRGTISMASRPRAIVPESFGWPALSLDGNIVPLPGHTAPPAPVWLDGAPRRR